MEDCEGERDWVTKTDRKREKTQGKWDGEMNTNKKIKK